MCAFVLLADVASAPVVARVLVLLLRLFLLNVMKLEYSGVASLHAPRIYVEYLAIRLCTQLMILTNVHVHLPLTLVVYCAHLPPPCVLPLPMRLMRAMVSRLPLCMCRAPLPVFRPRRILRYRRRVGRYTPHYPPFVHLNMSTTTKCCT